MGATGDAGLWVNRIPRRLRLDSVAVLLTGRDAAAPYLFVLGAAGLDVLLSLVSTVRYGTPAPLLQNPFWVLLPVVLLFAVWSVRRLRAWYQAVLDNVDLEGRTAGEYGTETFETFVSGRLRLGLYLLAVGIYAATMVARGSIPHIVATDGPVVGFLKFAVIIPFAYVPLGVEFASVFVEVHLRLPRLIRRVDLEMDYADPTDFGGMYRFGVLIKYSYYVFAAILLLFLLWTYAPVLFDDLVGAEYPPPGLETTGQFAAMWLCGTGLLAHSVLQFHLHMAAAKEEKLREITDRIRDLSDDPHTIPDTRPSAEDVERVRLEYDHLRRVKQIREYPIDLVMLSQLVFSILLPLVVERVFDALV